MVVVLLLGLEAPPLRDGRRTINRSERGFEKMSRFRLLAVVSASGLRPAGSRGAGPTRKGKAAACRRCSFSGCRSVVSPPRCRMRQSRAFSSVGILSHVWPLASLVARDTCSRLHNVWGVHSCIVLQQPYSRPRLNGIALNRSHLC